jgi:hypothetical protein
VDQLESQLAEALDRLSRVTSAANAQESFSTQPQSDERPMKRRRRIVRSYAGVAEGLPATQHKRRNPFDVKPEFASSFEWDETDFDHLNAMAEKGFGSLAFRSGMSGFLGTSSSAAALQLLSSKAEQSEPHVEHRQQPSEVSYNPYTVSVKADARPPQVLEEHLIQQFYWHHHPLYPLTFEPIFRVGYVLCKPLLMTGRVSQQDCQAKVLARLA